MQSESDVLLTAISLSPVSLCAIIDINTMTVQERWDYIINLDEELLKGGVILSEWTTFLVKDAETAFCSNANLSAILACQAAIESHLRYEYFDAKESKRWGFYQLIEKSSLNNDLKTELHELRIFRNKWMHVEDPSDDSDLLSRPEYHENELMQFSKKSIRTMLKTLYVNQWI